MIDTDAGRTTYSYDAAGQIATLKNPDDEVTSWTWDAAGRQTLKQLANGTRTSTVYDNAGRITAVYHLKSDNAVISSFDYTNNEVGHRTAVREADGDRVTWTYDATDQLTAEHRSGANAYSHTFTYDAVGNRLVKNEDTARTTYLYDVANRIQTAIDSSGTSTYTYDADGNQRSIETPTNDLTTYSWSYENKLRQLEDPSGGIYTYSHALVKRDGTEQRIAKDDGTDTTRFIWDEDRLLIETDDLGTTRSRYDHEPVRYGRLISQRQNAQTDYHHFDALGSSRVLTDESEVTTDEYAYEAFGQEAATSGTTPNPHRWVGQQGYYKDVESSLYSVRQRTFDPNTGRWMSKDPVRSDEHLTPYGYVRNSPLRHIDPAGTEIFAIGTAARDEVIQWYLEELGVQADWYAMSSNPNIFFITYRKGDRDQINYYRNLGTTKNGKSLHQDFWLAARSTTWHKIVRHENGSYLWAPTGENADLSTVIKNAEDLSRIYSGTIDSHFSESEARDNIDSYISQLGKISVKKANDYYESCKQDCIDLYQTGFWGRSWTQYRICLHECATQYRKRYNLAESNKNTIEQASILIIASPAAKPASRTPWGLCIVGIAGIAYLARPVDVPVAVPIDIDLPRLNDDSTRERCKELYLADVAVCKSRYKSSRSRRACYERAANRYARCLAGDRIRPRLVP